MMAMGVRIKELSVSFLGKEVLHCVSPCFAPKTLSVLIGRSGSGKTTLLRSINRLNEEFEGSQTTGQIILTAPERDYAIYPSKGKTWYQDVACTEANSQEKAHEQDALHGNQDLVEGQTRGPGATKGGCIEIVPLPLNELRLRVGMVFQTPNVFPVSVYQNIAMPLALVGGCSKKDAEGKVYEALKLVGLWDEVRDSLKKSAERLSGGQQQRLCLARVLALRPQVLLLDEPTASLDVHSGRHIEEVLAELARDYTVIMVSHGLAQARRLGSKIMICKEGLITHELDAGSEISEELLEEVV